MGTRHIIVLAATAVACLALGACGRPVEGAATAAGESPAAAVPTSETAGAAAATTSAAPSGGAFHLTGTAMCPRPGDFAVALGLSPQAALTDLNTANQGTPGALTTAQSGLEVRIPDRRSDAGSPPAELSIQVSARVLGTEGALGTGYGQKFEGAGGGPISCTLTPAPGYGTGGVLSTGSTTSRTAGLSPTDDQGLAVVDESGNWVSIEVFQQQIVGDTAVWPSPIVPAGIDVLSTWLHLIYPG
jgi:hypothetical protein